jgi:hypothetical protein
VTYGSTTSITGVESFIGAIMVPGRSDTSPVAAYPGIGEEAESFSAHRSTLIGARA